MEFRPFVVKSHAGRLDKTYLTQSHKATESINTQKGGQLQPRHCGCDYNVIIHVRFERGLNMKSRIVKIGDSQGICIPKPLIEQAGIGEEVEIEASGSVLIISPARPHRAGWNDAFQSIAVIGHDELLNVDTSQTHRWDNEEWEW